LNVTSRANPDHIRIDQTDDLHRQRGKTRVLPTQLFRNDLDSSVTHSNCERAGGPMSVRGDIGNVIAIGDDDGSTADQARGSNKYRKKE
jgi:hypothetical protein